MPNITHMHEIDQDERHLGQGYDEKQDARQARDNRRVRLTGAGREFREYARHSVAQWQQLRRKLGRGMGWGVSHCLLSL